MKSRLEQYGRFAAVYDKMRADKHSREMCKYLSSITSEFDIDPDSVLDLCCGTGTALRIFADYGWEIAGLDRSKEMLKVARKKLADFKAPLYRQELPRFFIPVRRGSNKPRLFDLITSFYDSLNYLLTEKKLGLAFQTVYRHLAPGGWFIFDMNTPHGLKTVWDGQVYAGAEDDLAWVWKNFWEDESDSALCEATFFVKSGRHYRRFTELHRERGYANKTVRKLLRDSGFAVCGYYRCFTFDSATADTNRICVVAKKR